MKTIIDYQNDEREKVLLDVRDKQEFEKETYPGARNWYWEELIKVLEETPEEFTQQFDKSVPIYLLCYTGLHSDDLADILEEMGYEVYSLYGGWGAYMKWKFENYVKEAQAENEISGEDRVKEIERSIVKKFRKPIWRKFTQALNEYDLIQDGDKIAVCISGGKDSMLMAKLFQELKRHDKFPFEVVFLCMDPGYSPENRSIIEKNAAAMSIPLNIFESDIFEAVYNVEKNPCYLCARMRRGHLYSKARELGCNKIALGHHFDDVIETILMGMLYGGQVQTMMPKLHSTNFEGMELIRPLYFIREDDIKHWRDYNDLHFIQCACRFMDTCTTCTPTNTGSKRQEIKRLIADMKKVNPQVEMNIFRSVENVNLNTVIAYKDDNGDKHWFLDDYDE